MAPQGEQVLKQGYPINGDSDFPIIASMATFVEWRMKHIAATSVFLLGGSFLLLMIAVVPFWNAASLLEDFNYMFWAGAHVPDTTIVWSVLIIVGYFVTACFFFRSRNEEVLTTDSVMNFITMFITLFGLFLMLASLPLTWETHSTTNNLMYSCDTSDQTHRLYEYSQVLHNIRATPACAKKLSVEQCDGYQESPPYTTYLKQMENVFRCAGFCYRPLSIAASANATAKSGTSLLDTKRQLHTELATDAEDSMETMEVELQASPSYPPTLFSDANFKSSCEGMAARDMMNLSGDIGRQHFFQGIYLVLISVATGFLKLIGMCVARKE